MANAPAGWYPNVNVPGTFLYWDGTVWRGAPYTQTELNRILASDETRIAAENARPLAGQGAGEAASNVRNSSASKIGLFGSRKAAQTYAAQADELRSKLSDYEVQIISLQMVVDKYGLTDDQERERLRDQLEQQIADRQNDVKALESNISNLKNEVLALRESIVDLRAVAGAQSLGLYDFEHPAETSVDLAEALADVRAKIKEAVSAKTATSAATGFLYNNSPKEGEKFVREMSALLLRAYNSEAENCVKGAKAGNFEANLKRLNTAVAQIEKQGSMISMRIVPAFHKLRVQEIKLATKYLQVLAVEKSAEQERRSALREEARVARELEREMKKLSDNKLMLESALAAARANGDERAIELATSKLAAVQTNLDNVNAMAANRRMGHVYVISNIGSFGPETVKIGMTRRMEPMDRVRELGDASVPFRFDVHAMIFSEDAVGLESSLHQKFESKRVNRINAHREFFRVSPQDVLNELREEAVVVKSFTVEPIAEEYRASIGEIELTAASGVDDAILDEDLTSVED